MLSVFACCSVANADVTVSTPNKQVLNNKHTGWTRYGDTDSRIKYYGKWMVEKSPSINNYGGASQYIKDIPSDKKLVAFYFKGTGFAIISGCYKDRTADIDIYVDGIKQGSADESQPSGLTQVLVYQAEGLEDDVHKVELYSGDNKYAMLDAIEVKNGGELKPWIDEGLKLNESSLDLNEGENFNLKAIVETYKNKENLPSVTWTSSNPDIATVDENGNVTAKKLGQVSITASINGTNYSDKCDINVKEVLENTDVNISGKLQILLSNGTIKEYSVTNEEYNDFKSWYNKRDQDHNYSPYYTFKVDDGEESIVHSAILSFKITNK